MIFIVRLNQSMFAQAAKWAKEIASTGLFQTANYTGLQINQRFETGYLGELALLEALKSATLKVKHHVSTAGRSFRTEIEVELSDRIITIEVKTASQPHYRRVMFPAAQKLDGDYICGVRLNIKDLLAEIMGFALINEAKKWPVSDYGHGVPTKALVFTGLRLSLDDLIETWTGRVRYQASYENYDMDRLELAWAAIGVKIDRVRVKNHIEVLKEYYGKQAIK